MNLWLALIAGGIITYLTRLSFIYFFSKQNIPTWLQSALRFVPPAVLTAIIFPEVLAHSGTLEVSASNLRLLAALVAALVAWRTRNALATIAVGMLVLFLLQAILSTG